LNTESIFKPDLQSLRSFIQAYLKTRVQRGIDPKNLEYSCAQNWS